MESFTGKLAVVTGGGTGMGRELTRQLAAEGCAVAICDVSATNMADTVAACATEAPGTKVTSFVADVSSEDALQAFRVHVEQAHDTDHLDLLFNNAGIGGGGSVVADPREEWEQVFNVCWGGVYLGVRTFLPLLLQSEEARIVNTSSVNGFWATLGPTTSHTAYSAAKFAVRGFSEALRHELEGTSVTVGTIYPSGVRTGIILHGRYAAAIDPAVAARAASAQAALYHTEPEDAAAQIIRATERRRVRAMVGREARLIDVLVRVTPTRYWRAMRSTLRLATDTTTPAP